MKNMYIWLVVAIVIIGGGWYFFMQADVDDMTATVPVDTTSTAAPEATVVRDGQTVSVTVTGTKFKFDPSEIKVKLGDTVKIHFVNGDGFHDWVIDEFNARTKQINGGQSDDISFVANKAGTFVYYCSVGNHRAMGMKGNLIVE